MSVVARISQEFKDFTSHPMLYIKNFTPQRLAAAINTLKDSNNLSIQQINAELKRFEREHATLSPILGYTQLQLPELEPVTASGWLNYPNLKVGWLEFSKSTNIVDSEKAISSVRPLLNFGKPTEFFIYGPTAQTFTFPNNGLRTADFSNLPEFKGGILIRPGGEIHTLLPEDAARAELDYNEIIIGASISFKVDEAVKDYDDIALLDYAYQIAKNSGYTATSNYSVGILYENPNGQIGYLRTRPTGFLPQQLIDDDNNAKHLLNPLILAIYTSLRELEPGTICCLSEESSKANIKPTHSKAPHFLYLGVQKNS